MKKEEKNRVGYNVKQLNLQIHKNMNEAFKSCDLTYSQCMVLRFLQDHKDEKICSVDIEKNFHLSHPTIVGLVKRLEEKKFIKTRVSTKDHRYKYIELTQEAENFDKHIDSIAIAVENQLIDGLSTQEVEEWFRITRKIMKNIETKGNESDD